MANRLSLTVPSNTHPKIKGPGLCIGIRGLGSSQGIEGMKTSKVLAY